MNLLNVLRLTTGLQTLAIWADQCRETKEDGGGGTEFVDEVLNKILAAIRNIKHICIEEKFDDAISDIECVEIEFGAAHANSLDVSTLAQLLKRLEFSLNKQLGARKFISVAGDRTIYVDMTFADLNGRFPSAIDELKEAANCLALECSTACVFHAMRAAEIALRALAQDRQVIPKDGPIELTSWGRIIDELEKAEKAILCYPRTEARESQLAFYHGAMMEFRSFKNKFRNNVMHTRQRYDRDEAESALTHVVEFMRALSTRIGETKHTQTIWTEHLS